MASSSTHRPWARVISLTPGTRTKYPEVWLDIFKAIDKAVNLPIIAHPTSGVSMYGVGLPVGPTLKICREVKNVVGWKMTYSYYGWKTVAEGLR